MENKPDADSIRCRPAIGGFLVAGSVPAAHIVNTLGLLTFVALLLKVNDRRVTRQTGRVSWRTVLAGMRFVWDTRMILAMISLDMLAVLLGGAVYLMPIFAEEILQAGWMITSGQRGEWT